MDPQRLARLVRQVSATEAEEISCAECFDLLAPCVEQEVAGAPPTERSRRLAQHVGQCAVCREEYEALRELLVAEPPDDPAPPHRPPADRPPPPPRPPA